jgi:hypothetical protein
MVYVSVVSHVCLCVDSNDLNKHAVEGVVGGSCLPSVLPDDEDYCYA